ncbi:MAG TPA: glycoside hydrolase family 97 catalytic domain-containing protein [Pyrinomonadaceae bacterium]|nr:glycoside hydrolase family 97 catalytic domain-containing protein [Pyrinomonadaceae bacterium]
MLSLAPSLFSANADALTLNSPNRQIQFTLMVAAPQLRWRATRAGQNIIEPSALSFRSGEIDVCHECTILTIERYRVSESYLTRGVHARAVNVCNGARISLRHDTSRTEFGVELRAYNDGVAFRFIFPGIGTWIPDEGSVFTIPADSTVWFHDFEGHYEGIHQQKSIADVKDGDWAAPPLTIKLQGRGYAVITEAALLDYSGMGLRANGERGFMTVLGHALPVSHPFDLRYGKDEAKRLSRPARVDGPVTTPWRVVIMGGDLNGLVNSDLINNLSPAPDRTIFPHGLKTSWIKPGRAVWRYLDGGENTFEGIKEFSRLAGQLGFEYNVVEGIWARWTEAQIRELVDYSNQQNVKLWFWKHRRTLGTQGERDEFFSLLSRLGVAGAKIDFFDHEAKEVIDLYQALLRSSAEHKVMVEFHGANKPAGESRTWPNEMSREAIRGLEYRSLSLRSVHNTTLPFTRFLAGHADYTPVHFGERRRETSWAHQIATAVVFTSPLMIYGAHPQHILDNPAAELIKTIPSVWDQTVVIRQSEIGELAGFARRKGQVWFLGIMNGLSGKTIRVPLRFLGARRYRATLVRDQLDEAAAVRIEHAGLSRADSLTIKMRAGGGFVARFE